MNPEHRDVAPDGKIVVTSSPCSITSPEQVPQNDEYCAFKESLILINEELALLRNKDMELQTLFTTKNNEEILSSSDEIYEANKIKKEEELKAIIFQMDDVLDRGRLLKVEKMYIEGKLKNS